MNTFGPGFLESALGIFRKRFPDGPNQDEPTMTVMGVPRPIDHLFFGLPEGWEASLERVDDRYDSDHHPLIGMVALEGQQVAEDLGGAARPPCAHRHVRHQLSDSGRGLPGHGPISVAPPHATNRVGATC